MLTYPEFEATVREALPGRFGQYWLNADQNSAVAAPPTPPVFIVAGPGTGKTTVLALRVLKLVLVDQFRPETILATTFTRKAAAELRSRILSWGYATISRARADAQQAGDQARVVWLSSLDINSVITGTLDALAGQLLADHRQPGAVIPSTVESFLAMGILRQHAMFPQQRHRNADLQSHLNTLKPTFPFAKTTPTKVQAAFEFADRVRHDGIDVNGYRQQGPGHAVLCDLYADYIAYLDQHYLADFARTEELFLAGLRNQSLQAVCDRLNAVLVDEFQDTNYLQEQIYLQLCAGGVNSLTVVGDDDQSVFRFRGATVEIFANFTQRLTHHLGVQWQPHRIDLRNNYRSTERIVSFCNHFITSDASFQGARIPNKLPLVAMAPHAHAIPTNLPVLGMFRPDIDTLAADVSSLLIDIFQGQGRTVQCDGHTFTIVRSPSGDFGDAVLLARTTQEYRSGQNPAPRLPLLLRQRLHAHGVRVFNPRGRSLGEIPEVQRLLGVALLCVDPQGGVLNGIQNMSPPIRNRLRDWRQIGQQYAATNPPPGHLQAFIQAWEARVPSHGQRWPTEWPLLNLLFTLVTWFPELQTDPEGQVYLEAVARTIAEAGQLNKFGSMILHGQGQWDNASISAVIRGVFEPLAAEEVDVDEEVMPHVPRTYFPMMTVHQAKGLEFPLVIADVGSDFTRNHAAQRIFRAPNSGGSVHVLEDIIAPFSPVGPLRNQRSSTERAWDDLWRLYYVAYSRAQDVLILVGLNSQLRTPVRIPAVATGDGPDGTRHLTFVPAAQWSPGAAAGTVALI